MLHSTPQALRVWLNQLEYSDLRSLAKSVSDEWYAKQYREADWSLSQLKVAIPPAQDSPSARHLKECCDRILRDVNGHVDPGSWHLFLGCRVAPFLNAAPPAKSLFGMVCSQVISALTPCFLDDNNYTAVQPQEIAQASDSVVNFAGEPTFNPSYKTPALVSQHDEFEVDGLLQPWKYSEIAMEAGKNGSKRGSGFVECLMLGEAHVSDANKNKGKAIDVGSIYEDDEMLGDEEVLAGSHDVNASASSSMSTGGSPSGAGSSSVVNAVGNDAIGDVVGDVALVAQDDVQVDVDSFVGDVVCNVFQDVEMTSGSDEAPSTVSDASRSAENVSHALEVTQGNDDGKLWQNVSLPAAEAAQDLETANAACTFSTVNDVSVSAPSDVLISDVEMIGESESLGASIVETESMSPTNSEALPVPSTFVLPGYNVDSDDVEVVSQVDGERDERLQVYDSVAQACCADAQVTAAVSSAVASVHTSEIVMTPGDDLASVVALQVVDRSEAAVMSSTAEGPCSSRVSSNLLSDQNASTDPTVIDGVAAREATAVASSGLVATSLQGDPTASTASPNANKRKKSCFNHRALNKVSGRSHSYNLRARSAKQIDTAFPAAVAEYSDIRPAPVIASGSLDTDDTADTPKAEVIQLAPEAALPVAPRRYNLRPRSEKQLETAKAAAKKPKKTRAIKKKAQPVPEPTSPDEVLSEPTESISNGDPAPRSPVTAQDVVGGMTSRSTAKDCQHAGTDLSTTQDPAAELVSSDDAQAPTFSKSENVTIRGLKRKIDWIVDESCDLFNESPRKKFKPLPIRESLTESSEIDPIQCKEPVRDCDTMAASDAESDHDMDVDDEPYVASSVSSSDPIPMEVDEDGLQAGPAMQYPLLEEEWNSGIAERFIEITLDRYEKSPALAPGQLGNLTTVRNAFTFVEDYARERGYYIAK